MTKRERRSFTELVEENKFRLLRLIKLQWNKLKKNWKKNI